MRMVQCVMFVGLLALGACLGSDTSKCGDLTCPMGTSCSADSKCVDTDLLDACRGQADGAACSVSGLPPDKCLGGICQAHRCGDGRVTGNEDCDGGNLAAKTCQSLGFYQPGGLGCTSDCKFDTAACVGRCGDGIKNGPEQCDATDIGGATCFTAGFYAAPGLACKSDCTFNTAACGGGRCGDGVINGLEQCDGTAISTTCATLGYKGALTTLKCSNTCTYTASSCRCTSTSRCAANTERCDCPKTGGCGCVSAI